MTFNVYYSVTTWLCLHNGQRDSCCSSVLWTVDVGQYFLLFLLLLFLEIFKKEQKKANKYESKWYVWIKPLFKNESKMCMIKKLRILIFELWSTGSLSFGNSLKTNHHITPNTMTIWMKQHQMLDDGFRTQIQNCLNVNAIKQVLFFAWTQCYK